MLDIIERIVDKESQFRNYTHLVAYALTEIIAQCLFVFPNVIDYFFALCRREYAKVGGAYTEVWTYLHSRYRHHNPVHRACLALEYKTQFFL